MNASWSDLLQRWEFRGNLLWIYSYPYQCPIHDPALAVLASIAHIDNWRLFLKQVTHEDIFKSYHIRKNMIWKSLSISSWFPKNGKFQEIVEIARKFLVTTANFLQGLEIVKLFSNMQFIFAWLHCVTYSFVFLLKCQAFCERAVTGKWTTSRCETKFIEVHWNSNIMWLCWILNFPTRKLIVLPSFPPTFQSTNGVLPPALKNGTLPWRMVSSLNEWLLEKWLPLTLVDEQLPPSMNIILPPLMNGIHPPSWTNGIPLSMDSTSIPCWWTASSLPWRMVFSLPCWHMVSSLPWRMAPSLEEQLPALEEQHPPLINSIPPWTAPSLDEQHLPSLVDEMVLSLPCWWMVFALPWRTCFVH